MIKKIAKIFYLLFLLILALLIDLLIFATTAGCPSCTSFSQFLTSSYSLTGPVVISLAGLFPNLTKIIRKLYNKKQ